ncbi:peroxisomal biogenesis factor 11 [Paraphysoderma sedebokerense]|nr:peroxisomal biogenesis factor 11 [Paraphysoderma sedebokerense]
MPSNKVVKPRITPRFLSFISSVSGTDKAFRTIIYVCKILVWYIDRTKGPKDPLLTRIVNLTTPLADTRMVLRLFGTIASLEYLLHPSDQKDPLLRMVEHLQNASMMIYYPFEVVYWLAIHKVIEVKDADQWSRWSCQAWGAWIGLELFVLWDKFSKLKEKMRIANKELKVCKDTDKKGELTKSLEEMKNQEDDLMLRVVSNVGDLPLAIHWSLKSYPLPAVWVGVFGTISSIAGNYLKWKYTSG